MFDIVVCEFSVIFAQIELIADPYRVPVWIADTYVGNKKICFKCKQVIEEKDLHKIVIYVVQEKFTEHHYEHVECPDKFTI